MKKSVFLVFVLGASMLAQTPDAAKMKMDKPKTEIEQLKSDLADEQARSAYSQAQLELSSAIMQAENAFHLTEKQNIMRAAYSALSTRLGCKAGLNEKLNCAPEPPKPQAPVNTMPKTIPQPPSADGKVKPGSTTPLKK